MEDDSYDATQHEEQMNDDDVNADDVNDDYYMFGMEHNDFDMDLYEAEETPVQPAREFPVSESPLEVGDVCEKEGLCFINKMLIINR